MNHMKPAPSEGEELELRAYKVNAPASEAHRAVINALNQSAIKEVAYAVRSRTKSVKKIIEKVHKKRNPEDDSEPKPFYEPEDIRDVVGVRIVTLFREDMLDVLRDILAIINHERDGQSPFIKGRVEEAIIYSPDVVGDTQAISNRVRAVLHSSGYENVTHNEVMQSMYSSIHLIAWSEAIHDGVLIEVPVEIQIRTVFEDAWGEIDHKLRYKSDHENINAKALVHLNVLKSFTDGCSKYADLIKLDCVGQSELQVPRSMVRAEGVEDVIKAIGDIDEKIIDKIKEAYELQNDGIHSIGAEKKDKLIASADKFQELLDSYTPIKAKNKQPFTYYMRMERAFCLLEAGDGSSLNEAVEIYLDMERAYKNLPVIPFRLGTALAKLNDEEEAIKALERARSLLEEDKFKDDAWLNFSIHRRLGFMYWQISTRRSIESDEKISYLVKAYNETKICLDFAGGNVDRLGALNNLVYFALDYFESLPEGRESEIDSAEFGQYSDEFIRALKVESANVYQLDTLARIYCYLGNKKEAVKIASQIEDILRKKIGMPDDESRSEMSFDQVSESLNETERVILGRAGMIISEGACDTENV